MYRIDFESPAVQSYLTILQAVIGRMATNSAGCKTWCIALVSAIIVIIADKEKPDYVWISTVPIGLFFILDSYYLGLERRFRDLYNQFIQKLHMESATVEDVLIVTPGAGLKRTVQSTLCAAASLSIWPFYGCLGAMLAVVRIWIL